MVIAPSSDLYVLSGCPLDKDYKHTIRFTNRTAQANYFMGLRRFRAENYTYIRRDRQLKIQATADLLLNCNYLMFRNTAFGSGWFYAFIDTLEYENNDTAIITFTIDHFQTWFMDCQIKPGFIIRQHSRSDNPGDNLVPESLEYGDYIIKDTRPSGVLLTPCIMVAATVDAQLNPSSGGDYGYLFSGLHIHKFNTADDATAFIQRVVSGVGADAIVSISMGPLRLMSDGPGPGLTENVTVEKNLSTIDGYKPKNKKLLTYPYNFLSVSNLQGNMADFHYEYFNSTGCEFTITADTTANPTALLIPLKYKGAQANRNEMLSLQGWPQCAYVTDIYKSYMAQNSASVAVNLVGGAVNTVAGVATAVMTRNPMAAVSGAMGVATQLATLYDKSNLPPQAHGGAGPAALLNTLSLDFEMMRVTIRAEFAKIIDGYFTMYGYAYHQTDTPNISVRPHWNFVQMADSKVTGHIPADSAIVIQNALNTGITFWKNGDEIGNYNLDNSI